MSYRRNVFLMLVLIIFSLFVLLLFLLLNKGSVEVNTTPSGATIFINEKERGKTPLKIRGLKPGSYTFTAKEDGFLDVESETKIKRGKNNLDMTLSPVIVLRLPHRGKNFYIERKADNNDVYKITLYAIINRPSQYESYLEQLKIYKKQALDWIRENNVDPGKIQIEYMPPEAKDL